MNQDVDSIVSSTKELDAKLSQMPSFMEDPAYYLQEYGVPFIKAIAVLLIGLWIIKKILRLFGKLMEQKEVDKSLQFFLKSLIGVLLKVMLIITVLGMFGVPMTSFIAILGAAGLAVGLALSGTLQNFAGGVIILLFKPFKVGETITAMGHTGRVKEIQIFVTKLLTREKKTVIIPNGPLSNSDIVNFTESGLIRVDLTIGISYGADINEAKNVLMKVMEDHPKVLADPAPFIGVLELADSSVNLSLRPHSLPDDYWEVYFDIYQYGKEALDAAGIEIPFPQMDIHQKK